MTAIFKNTKMSDENEQKNSTSNPFDTTNTSVDLELVRVAAEDNFAGSADESLPELDASLQVIEARGTVPLHTSQSVPIEAAQTSIATDIPVHASAFIAEPKGQRPKFVTALVVASFAVLVGLGGFAGWYFGLRTPDIEYERTAALIDAMIADAGSMEQYDAFRKSGGQISVGAQVGLTSAVKKADQKMDFALDQLKVAKDKSSDYVLNQKQLGSSAAIVKDDNINALYAVHQNVINQYGNTSTTTYGTMALLGPIVLTCAENLSSVANAVDAGRVRTAGEYDVAVKECSDQLRNIRSVPAKEINDSFYIPYRSMVERIIRYSHDLIDAKTLKQQQTALEGLNSVYADYAKVDTSKIQNLENSQDPTEQLTKLRDTVNQRKNLLFR